MSKIQDLKGTHNNISDSFSRSSLFLMSKIQDLKGTHNTVTPITVQILVVSDVKDTRFERNSQRWFNIISAVTRCF